MLLPLSGGFKLWVESESKRGGGYSYITTPAMDPAYSHRVLLPYGAQSGGVRVETVVYHRDVAQGKSLAVVETAFSIILIVNMEASQPALETVSPSS